jgi:hypothetical protein
MIITLSTGKNIELDDTEYKELVEYICKAQYKLSNIPLIQSSDGLYAGDKILDYFMQYGEKK